MYHFRPPLHRARRRFIGGLGALAAAALVAPRALSGDAPAIITSEQTRPKIPYGVMSGDTTAGRAIVWSKTDRPARMLVEVADNEAFNNARRCAPVPALAATDFTAQVEVSGLPAGEHAFYRVMFEALTDRGSRSEAVSGRLWMPPTDRRSVTFVFSGDEAGQGWGINPDFGGYRLYESMRREQPAFFIHSGDQIYADYIIEAEVRTDDGRLWKNLTTPAKSKVAETLDEFRGNFAYNLLDLNKRRFAAEVPFLVQWDDHETRNNWYPGQIHGDDRYRERDTTVLAAHGRQAMFEYNPMRIDASDPYRIYRNFDYGESLAVFMLDQRSYRGRNSPNRQTVLDADAGFLGATQTAWLQQQLLASPATWKIIASDMPVGVVVEDLNTYVPKGTFEALANGDDGPPSGRELELAALLTFIKTHDIRNVVWVTADVHYAAAFYYQPERARFTDFKPFWEFIAGPISAGTYGPNEIDLTFGPQTKFLGIPAGMKLGRSPLDGFQFYGRGKVDGATQTLTVSLHDLDGQQLYSVTLEPEV